MIGIISYGVGNIAAIATIYKQLNLPARIVSRPSQLSDVSRIILPGVGAFDWAMGKLNESGFRPALDEQVLGRGTPVLGICVGMQMLAKRSDEGELEGLGWVEGEVRRFSSDESEPKLRLPHMGWNDVRPLGTHCLFRGLENDARFYFLHSYYFLADQPDDVLALSEYGKPFASSIRHGNVFGAQFHPEKSHHWGVQLLKNFAEV